MFELFSAKEELSKVEDQSVTLVMSAGDLRSVWDEILRVLRPEGAVLVFGTKEHCQLHREHSLHLFRYEVPMQTCDWLSHGKYNRAYAFRLLEGHEGVERRVYNPEVIPIYQGPNKSDTMEKCWIRTYTNKGDTILDPAGDWGTFLAAMDLGRKYIGVQEDFGKLEEMHYYNDI